MQLQSHPHLQSCAIRTVPHLLIITTRDLFQKGLSLIFDLAKYHPIQPHASVSVTSKPN